MTESHPFTSLRDQLTKNIDVIRLARESLLNLEFDFKRKPVNPRMEEVAGMMHLAFDTTPWPHSSDGLLQRVVFDGWRRQNCLKTIDGNDHNDIHPGWDHPLAGLNLCTLFHELFDHAEIGGKGMLQLTEVWFDIKMQQSGCFKL